MHMSIIIFCSNILFYYIIIFNQPLQSCQSQEVNIIFCLKILFYLFIYFYQIIHYKVVSCKNCITST